MDTKSITSFFAPILRLFRILATVWKTASEKHIGLIAAGVAFFGIFGIFPGIAAVIAIFGLMADPVVIAEQLALMDGIIPPDAYRLLSNQVNGLVNTGGRTHWAGQRWCRSRWRCGRRARGSAR